MNLDLLPFDWTKKVAATAVLISFYLLLRFVVYRWIKRAKLKPETLQMWNNQSRMFSNILVVLGAALIWGSTIKDFALSMAAVAVAFVIAFKEILVCMIGGVYILGARPFRVGDRISLHAMPNQIRGDVLRISPLCTHLQEVGPDSNLHQFTGKIVTLPNSMFLTLACDLESPHQKFHLHTFRLILPLDENLLAKREQLIAIAKEKVADFQEKAARSLKELKSHDFVETPAAEPRVAVNIVDKDSAEFVVRVPVPSKQAGRIQSQITLEFLSTGLTN